VPIVGSAEKMMGQATTMELLYTQTKLNVKSKASDLGGLIYIHGKSSKFLLLQIQL
jgi:hypothetical protein